MLPCCCRELSKPYVIVLKSLVHFAYYFPNNDVLSLSGLHSLPFLRFSSRRIQQTRCPYDKQYDN